jgi:hypothetical protein
MMPSKKETIDIEITYLSSASSKLKESAVSCLNNQFIDSASFIELSQAYLSIERVILELISLSHLCRVHGEINAELKAFDFDNDDDNEDD